MHTTRTIVRVDCTKGNCVHTTEYTVGWMPGYVDGMTTYVRTHHYDRQASHIGSRASVRA